METVETPLDPPLVADAISCDNIPLLHSLLPQTAHSPIPKSLLDWIGDHPAGLHCSIAP
jgi:hypothetical protein